MGWGRVPEVLRVFAVFGRFPWAPGRLFYPLGAILGSVLLWRCFCRQKPLCFRICAFPWLQFSRREFSRHRIHRKCSMLFGGPPRRAAANHDQTSVRDSHFKLAAQSKERSRRKCSMRRIHTKYSMLWGTPYSRPSGQIPSTPAQNRPNTDPKLAKTEAETDPKPAQN